MLRIERHLDLCVATHATVYLRSMVIPHRWSNRGEFLGFNCDTAVPADVCSRGVVCG